MILEKIDGPFGMQVFFRDELSDSLNKCLKIFYGGNGDLYWVINCNQRAIKQDFKITKDNEDAYILFEELFNDVKRLNTENSKEPYDEEKNTITWYSDDNYYDNANILKITKSEEVFEIEFYVQPTKEEERSRFLGRNIEVRLCNSGSRYEPFNTAFMKMYNKMVENNNILKLER